MEHNSSTPTGLLLFFGSGFFHVLAFVEKSTISWALGAIMAILGIINLIINIKLNYKNLKKKPDSETSKN